MLGQRVRPARIGALFGRAVSLACVVALCDRGAGGVAVEGGSSRRSRSCRLVVRWPYMAGLRDSWARACYFSDLAGGFGCSLEYPDPDVLLGEAASALVVRHLDRDRIIGPTCSPPPPPPRPAPYLRHQHASACRAAAQRQHAGGILKLEQGGSR